MSDTRNNPSFHLFPINYNRTGYKPYAMPVVYIEPNRLNSAGGGIADSETLQIRFYVENAPDPAKVAGPFNQNIRIPDQALFEIELSAIDLARRQLDLRGLSFFAADGTPKSFTNAVEGDSFQYVLRGTANTFGSNPEGLVPYYPDAYYYDLSDVEIDVDQLQKLRTYSFIWQATYFRRIASVNGDFKCISGEVGISARLMKVSHPGDIHEFMFRSTPELYFEYEEFAPSSDKTLEFYRPFADVLQDIFDEQEFLDGINQINTIPAEYVPYLAYLIGWDLPNYPGTTDALRRKILKQAVHLQKLKGTKRVINELFELFGFVIDLINLYASQDGNRYLAPNDGLDTELQMQTDVTLSDYSAQGFGLGNVPFTFRPRRDSQIVLYAWQVQDGSTAYNELAALSNKLAGNLEAENTSPVLNAYGLLEPQFVRDIGSSGNGIVGFSTVEVGVGSRSVGRPVINHKNISYNIITNLLSLYFDHELSVDSNTKVFIYGVYEKVKIIIPDTISNTRTNKFDVEIIDRDGFVVDFSLLQFLLDFLFKLKAFHSLLRKIKITVRLDEVYNVIDMCVNGKDPYAPGTVLGDLQTPPAIVPLDLTVCQEDGDRGFKPADLYLRQLILGGLEEEFQAWKALSPGDCALTPDGQDKVRDDGCLEEPTLTDCRDYDHEPDDRETLCQEDPSQPNYCYNGRVKSNLDLQLAIILKDRYRCQPCGPGMGDGVYWEQDRLRTLHYSDDSYLTEKVLDFEKSRAVNLFNINIQKDNLGYPSHRFIEMYQLRDDFDYTTTAINEGYTRDYARKRPWDSEAVCGVYDNLNARLVDLTDGDQFLVWDDTDLVYEGNGLLPDIPSLDNHCSDPTTIGKIVTHKLYQTAPPSHSALSFESTIFTIEEFVDTDTLPTGKIFSSTCEVDNSDYIGGYPASTDCVAADVIGFSDGDTSGDTYIFCTDEPDPTCDTGHLDRPAIATALEMPQVGSAARNIARYFGNSMIYLRNTDVEHRYYVPYRLDCECLNNSCNVTESVTDNQETACNAPYITDANGNLDVGCDKIEIDLAIALEETMTLCSRITNNDLPNLFCLNAECEVPERGDFVYKDDYGIIYEVEWVVAEDTMDIVVSIKDPRIPGEEAEGYVVQSREGARVFRKGIISIVRQIIKFTDLSYYIDAEGSEVSIGYFQTNVVCNQDQFDDPFSYGINCALKDSIEMMYTDGPRWQNYEDPTNTEYVWASYDATGTGDNSLIWT